MTVDAVDRAGLRPDGTVINDLPQSRELLEAAFEAEAGHGEPAGQHRHRPATSSTRSQDITAARDRTLDEVQAKVVADWKAAEAEKRLDAKAADVAEAPRRTARRSTRWRRSSSVEKQTKRGLKREADDGDFGQPGVAAIFGVAEGGSGRGALRRAATRRSCSR